MYRKKTYTVIPMKGDGPLVRALYGHKVTRAEVAAARYRDQQEANHADAPATMDRVKGEDYSGVGGVRSLESR